jgi:hypothetical protein
MFLAITVYNLVQENFPDEQILEFLLNSRVDLLIAMDCILVINCLDITSCVCDFTSDWVDMFLKNIFPMDGRLDIKVDIGDFWSYV